MVSALSLWLPILLSAVFVVVASSVIHMVLTVHRKDFAAVPSADEFLAALRPFRLPEGEYFFPHLTDPGDREADGFKEKLQAGPVGYLTVIPADYRIGLKLSLWFGYCLLVGLLAAYLAGLALEPGASYMAVFRFVGTAALASYSVANAADSSSLSPAIAPAMAWVCSARSAASDAISATS